MKSKTTKYLKLNLNLIKGINSVLSVSLLIIIYSLLIKENKLVFFSPAISCAVLLPGLFATKKKIETELKSRNELAEN